MFERAACPDELPLTAEPFVTVGALAELSTLLDLALKDLSASSNAPFSGASRTSHDQNRGEAHVTEDGDVSEQMPALSAVQAAADGPVQDRPGGFSGRTAVARVAGRRAVGAHRPDDAADPQSCYGR